MKSLAAFLLLTAALAPAQWTKIPTAGIPRTKDGKVDLAAPVPHRADGQPDFSGIWQIATPKYLINIAADFKPGDLPMQPWAAALTQERGTGIHAREEPQANCLPPGLPSINATPNPLQNLSGARRCLDPLRSLQDLYRQIFMDGRELAKDPNPTWLGYSTGKWDGDTLVVDTTGFNGKTWLDQAGHPTTRQPST